MKTAKRFLAEWAGQEHWKIHVLNIVKKRSEIDSSQLLEEILEIIKNKKLIDNIPETDREEKEQSVLNINTINAPKNINALSRDIQFSLGKNLNVFYGENGSGKSSYVRMFRKLADNYFTNEKELSIIPNVYEEESKKESLIQTVEVTYTLDGNIKKDVIDINEKHSVLCKINVFDSESVLPLINSDLSFSILPKGFELFHKISTQLDALRNEITKAINVETVNQNNIFADSSYNFIRAELEGIMKEIKNSNQIKSYLDGNYPRSEAYEEVIQEINLQIQELESSNQKDKIKILSAQRSKLVSIKEAMNKMSVVLSSENIENINELIKDYEIKVLEERDFNESFERNVSFLEVVNNEWLSFINSGKRYFDSINKTNIKLGEACIFCSNPLSITSVGVVESHLKHIANSNKEKLISIEKELQRYDVGNMNITFADEEIALFESQMFLERIKSAIQLVNRNKELFNSLLKTKQVISDNIILDVTDVVQEIINEIQVLDYRIDNLKKSESEITEIVIDRRKLKETIQKNEKLHLSIEHLKQWFQIRNKINDYTIIKRKFLTNTLTQKQGEAFNSIVQDEYFETFGRFSQELKVSNVNLRLIPKKGQTLRKKFVSSKEYKVAQIMSEGEQKAVAMAEFATDLTLRKDFNTILLDDPVTSMDYKRSELIANLIYHLSLERQVVVFTHNIMFYYYLYNACFKSKNKENKFFKVDEYDQLNKGIVSESFSGRLETLKEVMSKLKVQEQTINSKNCFGDVLEEALKKVYSDIRTWCELIVEEGFFKSVIRRYEPNIMFTKVKSIKGDFVDELDSVSELFEKSCRWMAGHSQPFETQNVRASKVAFNTDMTYIHKLFEAYK
jgi:energy-coupling factor transporter ATP-binding protein EcfA2